MGNQLSLAAREVVMAIKRNDYGEHCIGFRQSHTVSVIVTQRAQEREGMECIHRCHSRGASLRMDLRVQGG